jgi:hypothetical protein
LRTFAFAFRFGFAFRFRLGGHGGPSEHLSGGGANGFGGAGAREHPDHLVDPLLSVETSHLGAGAVAVNPLLDEEVRVGM